MLKHDQQFEVFGPPAGTTAVIVEESPGIGFVPAYWDNGVLGDGAVTVADGTTVSVIVVNDYTPTIPDNPKTGDDSNLALWVTLMFISGGAALTLCVYDKKNLPRC